ncbi:hypothetical protein F2P81_021682 [Scophthalmus maximus]|uniref:Uncharacterized protein n=1 Tax=Scophthalmus maximus TaxID=52904 RepID=A0A6A4S3X8_SCOMX|nr:hypothetical protein F2P81_021682 [Scophthalmus maximus]
MGDLTCPRILPVYNPHAAPQKKKSSQWDDGSKVKRKEKPPQKKKSSQWDDGSKVKRKEKLDVNVRPAAVLTSDSPPSSSLVATNTPCVVCRAPTSSALGPSEEGFHLNVAKRLDIIKAATRSVNRLGTEDVSASI